MSQLLSSASAHAISGPPPPSPQPADADWASRRQVEKALVIGTTKFFALLKSGDLPSFMVGGRRMCRWGDVRAYQRKCEERASVAA